MDNKKKNSVHEEKWNEFFDNKLGSNFSIKEVKKKVFHNIKIENVNQKTK